MLIFQTKIIIIIIIIIIEKSEVTFESETKSGK